MAESPLIHVVDDDASVRDSLALLLESAGFQVRAYDSAVQFLAAASPGGVGCVLTDVQMPELNGLELQQRMGSLGIRLPVIVMTGHADVPIAVQALKAGAADFLEKPFDDDHLLGAVKSALDREADLARRKAEVGDIQDKLAVLSNRERQVLDGLVAGNANKTIAFDLGISPRTVEIYRANLMTKMAANSLSDLVRMAMMTGML